MAGKKLWAGRFSQGTHEAVEEFTASLHFDHKLYTYDIQGSIAHCRMLARRRSSQPARQKRSLPAWRKIGRELDAGQACPAARV